MAQGARQETNDGGYPNAELVAGVQWLQKHRRDDGVVIVDVRTDDHFDGELIPGPFACPGRNSGKTTGAETRARFSSGWIAHRRSSESTEWSAPMKLFSTIR